MHGLYTPGHRYGLSGVQVRVALENPRVTCANPYIHILTRNSHLVLSMVIFIILGSSLFHASVANMCC